MHATIAPRPETRPPRMKPKTGVARSRGIPIAASDPERRVAAVTIIPRPTTIQSRRLIREMTRIMIVLTQRSVIIKVWNHEYRSIFTIGSRFVGEYGDSALNQDSVKNARSRVKERQIGRSMMLSAGNVT